MQFPTVILLEQSCDAEAEFGQSADEESSAGQEPGTEKGKKAANMTLLDNE